MGTNKRKYSKRIQVVVSDDEFAKIAEAAESVGLSHSAYLRELGLGYAPAPVYDLEAVEQMMKLNADQGRLGGLIKMWLSNDERLMMFERESLSKAIFGVLKQIEELQRELLEVVKMRRILAAKKRF